MPAGKSTYLSNKILDFLLGVTSYTVPPTLYFALFTAAPTDAGGGTEVATGSYGRIGVTNNGTNFPNASAGAKSNAVAIPFTEATAGWGTVVAFGIYDASTSGNLLFWAMLGSPIPIPTGGRFSFSIGQVQFTED